MAEQPPTRPGGSGADGRADRGDDRADRNGGPGDGGTLPLIETHSPAAPALPDIADLQARLRFSPRDGRIWLDDRRMVLLHVRALASLRRELIDSLGMDTARGLLTRMGYQSGASDGEFARKVRGGRSYFDILAVGPQLHSLEGVVAVDPINVEVDVAKGHYYGEFLWRDSSEVDAHVQMYGRSSAPVCWSQIGYACGYTSVFMGRPILYREVECRGMGHKNCRIIGKPLEEWEDPEPDIRYFQPEAFANRLDRSRPRGKRRGPRTVDTPKPLVEGVHELVGASSSFAAACHLLTKVACTDTTVLFLGETGVGKEMFARTLHRISKRKERPFVAVNCAAIPENLVEAELFGVERGAFTGANQSRPGRFERADGGTLFLDEIGTLNMSAQGKLLRALQEGEIERVGDVRTRNVDVRVIAATNVDLREEVRAGRFREDLFYRLNIFPVRIPPLRERRDDIPLLMNHFLRKYAKRQDKTITGFTEQAINALLDYDFPGNIRELENMIERAIILASDNSPLDIGHLFTEAEHYEAALMSLDRQGGLTQEGAEGEEAGGGDVVGDIVGKALDTSLALEDLEQRLIREAVERSGGNLSSAARMLGMTRAQLAYRFRKSGGDGDDEGGSD